MAGAVILAAIILAGATVSNAQLRDYKLENLDLIRILTQKPWAHRWDPRDEEQPQYADDESRYSDDFVRAGSDKRSAVATTLHGPRYRRLPGSEMASVGKDWDDSPTYSLLNDVDKFFNSLMSNAKTYTSTSPQQRTNLYQGLPMVVQTSYTGDASGGGIGGGGGGARDRVDGGDGSGSGNGDGSGGRGGDSSGGGGGGGSGIRKLYALRPLRPGNIRSYNRRSDLEAYPGANHHDPGLLWTGLGR